MPGMKWISACVLSLVLCFSAGAQSPDVRYVQIYNLIQQADSLNQGGQNRQAAERYLEAEEALKNFKKLYPSWNEKVVNFRLAYLGEKVAALSRYLPQQPAPGPTTPQTPIDPAELAGHVQNLTDEVQRLQSEKTFLEAKLKEALSARPSADSSDLARAEAQILVLQKERDVLRVALDQERAKSATAKVSNPAREEKGVQEELAQLEAENKRLRQAGKERDNLEKKLAAANREITTLKSAASSRPRNNSSTEELTRLRARLGALEARSAPFTAEELALFKKPEPQIVVSEDAAPRKKTKDLPVGTGALVTQAERAFAERRFEDAEAKYLEVLRQDEDNVYTLANLAAIQLELGRLDEAEKNLARALTLDPADAFSLTLLGMLKFSRDDYDGALEALARSAQIDPANPETQNYLGITLSQKGQRAPAEAALRKAIQLKPEYASAHHNLAIIYATQTPPFLELARWHYQKAIALGHARNADLEQLLAGS
jgi:Flp pilus assembly protein TadD